MYSLAFLESLFGIGGTLLVFIFIGVLFSVLTCFRKVEQGDVLPQKSTFFSPKIPGGLVLRMLED